VVTGDASGSRRVGEWVEVIAQGVPWCGSRWVGAAWASFAAELSGGARTFSPEDALSNGKKKKKKKEKKKRGKERDLYLLKQVYEKFNLTNI